MLVHVGVLVILAATLARAGPIRLWKGIRQAGMITFTTRSNAATLLVAVPTVTAKLKVLPKVANSALPLGATMNMDRTALYQGVAIIFLIHPPSARTWNNSLVPVECVQGVGG